MKFPPINEQMDGIKRGIDELIPEEEMVEKLEKSAKTGEPLRIKLGCDPSRPDLHIGHAVVLRKLRQFQDFGHKAQMLVGDFTAMIGDPSGRNKTRPQLTETEIRDYSQTYFEQAKIILDEKNLDILYNSGWLGKMNFSEVIQLSAKYTVARMLERNDFEKRYKGGIPISIHEFLYPLAQGMDSVALKSDVELGGTDQKFNLLVGRDLQTAHGIEPQIIITLPLLEGTDGVEKMSKSYDNYIGITDSAEQMFGKTLSIPDELIVRWFDLATDISQTELGEIKAKLADDSANPRDLKRQLAREIIKVYYDENQAEQAQTAFDQIFIKKDVPDEIPEFALPENPMWIVKILRECGAVQGGGEAKRMLKGGGVSIDGEKIQTPDFDFELKDDSAVLKVGKRKFYRLVK